MERYSIPTDHSTTDIWGCYFNIRERQHTKHYLMLNYAFKFFPQYFMQWFWKAKLKSECQ